MAPQKWLYLLSPCFTKCCLTYAWNRFSACTSYDCIWFAPLIPVKGGSFHSAFAPFKVAPFSGFSIQGWSIQRLLRSRMLSPVYAPLKVAPFSVCSFQGCFIQFCSAQGCCSLTFVCIISLVYLQQCTVTKHDFVNSLCHFQRWPPRDYTNICMQAWTLESIRSTAVYSRD